MKSLPKKRFSVIAIAGGQSFVVDEPDDENEAIECFNFSINAIEYGSQLFNFCVFDRLTKDVIYPRKVH